MIPILPKDFLWTDKTTIEDFFEQDPLNKEFYKLLSELPPEFLNERIDFLQIFNEVYYQATRLIFELPSEPDIKNYVSDIKANMGWNYGAQLVMTMLYHMLHLYVKDERRVIVRHLQPIHRMCYNCPYWPLFHLCYERLKAEGRVLQYIFRPRPLSAEYIYWNYGSWDKLTMNFDMEAIRLILGLWKDEHESIIIASRINDCMFHNTNSLDIIAKREQLKTFLDDYVKQQKRKTAKQTSNKESNKNQLIRENEALRQANVQLQQRIRDMEAEKAIIATKTIAANHKTDGGNRIFTLSQIRNYCVDCVEWADVKSIVVMLNKLLRSVGTDEDSDLIDSIEEEFKKRTYGNTHIEHQTLIPKVENYYDKVQTVENKFPKIPSMEKKKKKIE